MAITPQQFDDIIIPVEKFEIVCSHYETSVDGFQTSAEKFDVRGSTAYDHKDDACYCGRYARAHDKKMSWLFEEVHRVQNLIPPTDENGRTDNGWVTWQKNRVDLLKWTISKLFPKLFGDKTSIEHSGTVAVTGPRVIELIPENDDNAE